MPRALAARLAVLGGILFAPSVGFAQAQHDGHPHAGAPPAALGRCISPSMLRGGASGVRRRHAAAALLLVPGRRRGVPRGAPPIPAAP